MLTEIFYESGFNEKPWSLTDNPQLDIFYCEFNSCFDSVSLLDELMRAASRISSLYPNAAIFDDDSIESKILMKIAPQLEIIKLPSRFEPDPSFLELCQNKYYLSDPEMIFALALTQALDKPLLFSRWAARILNVNFQTQQKSPYFVYVENEKYHRLALAQNDLDLKMSWNFLKSSPQLFRSYFFEPRTQAWLSNDCIEFDNYTVEREIFVSLSEKLGCPQAINIHRTPWPLGPWSKKIENKVPEQQASFPLHLLFKQTFGVETEFNIFERTLYG